MELVFLSKIECDVVLLLLEVKIVVFVKVFGEDFDLFLVMVGKVFSDFKVII